MKKIFTLACAAIAAISFNANAADIWAMPGTYNGWSLENNLFEEVDGVLTQKIAEIKGDFKVVKYTDEVKNWDIAWGVAAAGDIVEANKDVALTFKGENANLPAGKVLKNVTVTIVPGADNALTIKFAPESIEDEQEAWYLVGEAPLEWNFNDNTIMTKAGDNVYTKTVAAATADKFTFKVDKNGAWSNCYVLPEDVEAVELGQEYELVGPADSPNNMHIAADWTNVTVTVTIDGEKVKMVCTAGEGAIEAIEADNTPAIYFNLMGQRVANPENGVFVRVQNGKATKVIL